MIEGRKKRTYNSRDRLEKARSTTADIAKAAEALFQRDGYAGVTMKDIARAAGVAPATVYLHFPSKAKIVEALAMDVTSAPDLSVEHLEGEPASNRQLQIGASIMRRLNERSWLVVEIVRAHAGADPELKALGEEWRRRHLDAVTRGVQAMTSAGELRPGLSIEDAIDLMYAIGGTDLYRSLVRERGWSPERYEAWLIDFATSYLLTDANPTERPGA